MDNADKKLEFSPEPVRNQIWRPYALVRNNEAAFGGTVFIEFIAYRAKTNGDDPGLAYACPEPFVSASP